MNPLPKGPPAYWCRSRFRFCVVQVASHYIMSTSKTMRGARTKVQVFCTDGFGVPLNPLPKYVIWDSLDPWKETVT